MRLVARRYSNNWWFIICGVIFFLFPGLPHSEMLGVAASCHFLAPTPILDVMKMLEFFSEPSSFSLLSWVRLPVSDYWKYDPGAGGEFPEYPAIFRSAGRAKVNPGVSGLNCNIVKSERGRGILWFEAEPGKSSWVLLALACQDQPRPEDVENFIILSK